MEIEWPFRRFRIIFETSRKWSPIALNLINPQPLKILVRRIIELRQTSRIGRVSLGNANNHPLAGTGHEHPVGIELVGPPLFLVDVLPAIAPEMEIRRQSTSSLSRLPSR